MRSGSYRGLALAPSRVTVSQLERERAEREAAQAPVSDPQPEPAYVPPPAASLPIRQQMVILLLRRSELADRVVQELRMRYQPEPVASDWNAMITAGYVVRVPRDDGSGQTKLALKPTAYHTAQDLCDHYVKTFRIHHVTRHKARGNHGPAAVCTCSWGTFASIRNAASVERYIGDHLRQVRDQTLPLTYRMGAK